MTIYRQHFGLTGDPFHVTPDFSMLLLTKSHREAMGAISYGLRDRKGFMVATGEVGTGKTTVLRACLDELPAGENVIVYIFEPRLDTNELYSSILEGLPSRPDGNDVSPDESKSPSSTLLRRIQQALVDIHVSGRRTVLAVDEAQHLCAETLESLRLLSNLETRTEKLLQIVLVGQPELNMLLRRHDLRQLEQRIAVRAHIAPLSRRESRDYIRHRLSMAGWCGSYDLFTAPAMWLLAQRARGIPRRLNVLCDNALVNAYGVGVAAYDTGRRGRIGLWRVARSAPGATSPPRRKRIGRWLAVACMLLAAAGLFVLDRSTQPHVASPHLVPPPGRVAVQARVHAATGPMPPLPLSPLTPVRLVQPADAAIAPDCCRQLATPLFDQAGFGYALPAPLPAALHPAAPAPVAPHPTLVAPAKAPTDLLPLMVFSGDSLSAVCVRVYRTCSRARLQAVIDANRLSNPDHLMAGQVVVLPGVSRP